MPEAGLRLRASRLAIRQTFLENHSLMRLLDQSFPTTEVNLACDEALLEACEAGEGGEVLRLWAPETYAVVLGRSNVAEQEADLDACRRAGIPVLRRCSGGGAVLQGPGCLNYALVLELEGRPPLRTITGANRYLMDRHAEMLSALSGRPVRVQGTTDLAIDGRKCSGNAQRRQRRCMLFHGAFLLGLDFEQVERYLRMPSRMPPYRQGRSHREFLTNVSLPPAVLRAALRATWRADEPLAEIPWARIETLISARYSRVAWNLGAIPSQRPGPLG